MFQRLGFAIFLLSCIVQAWWDKAHIIVARIAYDELLKKDNAAYKSAVNMLDVLRNDPDVSIQALTHEGNYTFIECAPFADTIKGQGYSFQSNWHFVDTPYLDDEPNVEDYPFDEANPMNASSVIGDLYDYLRQADGATATETYATIAPYFESEASRESFAMRLLIHYVGDIHQPCHGLTRVDDAYPNGDRGCNNLHLQTREDASNLHAVWDSDIYQFNGYQGLPMWDSTWENYGTYASEIETTYPIDESVVPLSFNSPYVWSQENLDLAPTVYVGVETGDVLTDEYIAAARLVTGSRIHYAGVRLAQMVSDIFEQRAQK